MGTQLLFIYKLRNARNDVEAFTFLTFQRPRLKPKPISRFMPNLKAEGNLKTGAALNVFKLHELFLVFYLFFSLFCLILGLWKWLSFQVSLRVTHKDLFKFALCSKRGRRASWVCNHAVSQGPLLRRSLLASCSAVAVLEYLIIFEQGTQLFFTGHHKLYGCPRS